MASPYIAQCHLEEGVSHADGLVEQLWQLYCCQRFILVVFDIGKGSHYIDIEVSEYIPGLKVAFREIPDPAYSYLNQALGTMHAPDGAILLACAAINAMLKSKGFVEGTLYKRIEDAVRSNLLAPNMQDWAHHVRLEANDQRHADKHRANETGEQAKACVDFASALGDFLFVLPARVTRGIKRAGDQEQIKS